MLKVILLFQVMQYDFLIYWENFDWLIHLIADPPIPEVDSADKRISVSSIEAEFSQPGFRPIEGSSRSSTLSRYVLPE